MNSEPSSELKALREASIGRQKFIHEGNVIYEWEQTLTDVYIYMKPPEGVKKNDMDIKIMPRHLKIGLKNARPFLDEEFFSVVDASDSFWIMGRRTLNRMPCIRCCCL
eukprot:GHVU01219927.1.p1 GENE.GHVU01219927.1~~GHVU01219927.1.p1  ORF type:complete len:121 (+),score=17.17 GHVU01219927.1:42-365(+)